MTPTLYMIHDSVPVRAVLLTAKAIGLTLNEKNLDLLSGEHKTPEFTKLNPQSTVPTLEDDGFVIWDSHAIITYLVSKYAKNDSLYPKDLQKRAIVDQRLHFDSGVIFPRLLGITRPIVFSGRTTIYQEDKDNMIDAYGIFEKILEGKQWAAGDFLSVADYSLISSIGSINILVPVDSQKFPNVTNWMKRVESLPEYEANKKGLQKFEKLYKSKLAKA